MWGGWGIGGSSSSGNDMSGAYVATVHAPPKFPKPIRIYTCLHPDTFILHYQYTANMREKPILIVERKDNNLGKLTTKSLEEMKPMLKSVIDTTDAYGIIGIIRIPAGTFLVVITECKCVGRVNNSDVYTITDTAFLPLANHQVVIQDPIEKQNLEKGYSDIRKWLNGNSFYFSFDSDITSRLQSISPITHQQQHEGDSTRRQNFWSSADVRFFWNRHLLHYFIKQKLNDWILPIMKGYVEVNRTSVDGKTVDIAIVSRLSCLRAGTRFNARGVNDDGNVANFVESEQIVSCNGITTSFVILRGSVPIFWEQKMVRGKFRSALSRGKEATTPAFKAHFEDSMRFYGSQYIVNLLSPDKESEKPVIDGFVEQLNVLDHPNIKYLHFDFHQKVGKNGAKINQLASMLMSDLFADLLKAGVYVKESNQIVKHKQNGVFRVNCLDCLDRTNVCETAIARRALTLALQLCDVLDTSNRTNSMSSDVLDNSALEEIHKQMWANNGDAMSIAYTGTGALKSKLTRTGKLTLGGMMDDGMKSVMRTYQNMVRDDNKQDVIDYFLGNQNLTEEIEEESDWFVVQLRSRENEFTEYKPYTVYVGTYNIGGMAPNSENLGQWLGNINPSPSEPDVYVIGFQEVVSLNTKAVWNADEGNSQNWQKHIIGFISGKRKFVILRSYQLVGILITVFVPETEVGFYRDVQSERSKAGFAGIAGNKGAVSIRFNYHQSTFCFTCGHLAAGQQNYQERSQNYASIISSTQFRTTKGRAGILDHNFIFFFGDLNYRLNMEYDDIRRGISGEHWDSLFNSDQLRLEMDSKNAFVGFNEGAIAFPPTYRFDIGTNTYDTSEKRRKPAWCDRILFSAKEGVTQYNYRSTPLLSSDHKPVSAVFGVKVKTINKERQDAVVAELTKMMNASGFNEQKINEVLLVDFTDSPHPSLQSSFSSVDDAFDPEFAPIVHGVSVKSSPSPINLPPLPPKPSALPPPLPPKDTHLASVAPPLPRKPSVSGGSNNSSPHSSFNHVQNTPPALPSKPSPSSSTPFFDPFDSPSSFGSPPATHSFGNQASAPSFSNQGNSAPSLSFFDNLTPPPTHVPQPRNDFFTSNAPLPRSNAPVASQNSYFDPVPGMSSLSMSVPNDPFAIPTPQFTSQPNLSNDFFNNQQSFNSFGTSSFPPPMPSFQPQPFPQQQQQQQQYQQQQNPVDPFASLLNQPPPSSNPSTNFFG
eukprot:TRINITY_DN6701_c0_g1_i1.p1 TRINITY_DN6701_c0_g1~~TRINITY_DN6701_c0_g1_i1.p1  ORF type:complete len:1212 (-),score=389.34 TRINITY_DN6701_c0_g1_i1:62-3697(-)